MAVALVVMRKRSQGSSKLGMLHEQAGPWSSSEHRAVAALLDIDTHLKKRIIICYI